MLPYLVLAFIGLAVAYLVNTYRCFRVNLAAAKQSGLPYVWLPVYTFNIVWLVTHKLWLPFLEKLPPSWTTPWISFLKPDWVWDMLYEPFRTIGSDVFLVVAPGHNTLYVSDPEVISQITTRRNDFPKPIEMYGSVDIFGKNVVTTEGSIWRHHRKITSPPFTEKNNHLVWQESLHQAQSMMAGWVGSHDVVSKPISDVSDQAMRLALHVISRAGFGVRLMWPHEDSDQKVPEGHTLTYKDALSSLLENIITVMLSPSWMLKYSPLKFHKTANESFVEWGKYMREMYEVKRQEAISGDENQEGMDLMGAIVKGAGINSESSNEKDTESRSSGQLLTDDEILGNAFVMILAGHETAANTINFSLMYLAMNPESQRHLQKDLDDILGDRPISEWDYDADMPKLFGGMCGAVMNEELRLIPPVVGIPKCTLKGKPQGIQMNGQHYTVPGDCYITLNTPGLHRNPKHWPHTSEEDLNSFRPERWLVDSSFSTKTNGNEDTYATEEGLDMDGPDKRSDTAASLFRPVKGSYIPFSEGYRSCLGRRFAQVELLAVLAVIFKTWSVEMDVSAYATDEEVAKMDDVQKKAVWDQATARANGLLRTAMGTVITIQMRKGKVPLRFVRRGNEKFSH